MTQQELADKLRVTQAQVSNIERGADLYLSTLRRYVGALGGRLELTAVVDGKRFEPTLADLAEAPDPAGSHP
jgi:transcriptional regulator with XRE-family HTH domain